jgi:hypothetical protein
LEIGALQKAPEQEVSTEKLLCPKHAERAQRRAKKLREWEAQQGQQQRSHDRRESYHHQDQRSQDNMDPGMKKAQYFEKRVSQLAKKAKTRHQEDTHQYASSSASSSKVPNTTSYNAPEYLNNLPIKRPAALEQYLSPIDPARTYIAQPLVPVMPEIPPPVVASAQME